MGGKNWEGAGQKGFEAKGYKYGGSDYPKTGQESRLHIDPEAVQDTDTLNPEQALMAKQEIGRIDQGDTYLIPPPEQDPQALKLDKKK